jgi:hypothetical protein
MKISTGTTKTIRKMTIVALFMFVVINSVTIVTSLKNDTIEKDISCYHCHSTEV